MLLLQPYYLKQAISINNIIVLKGILHLLIPGGGGTQVQRGAAPSLRISRKKGSFFKTSACPRICKRRVLFCTKVRSMGVKIHEIYAALRPSDSRSDSGLPSLLPLLAAAKQAEDYKILS